MADQFESPKPKQIRMKENPGESEDDFQFDIFKTPQQGTKKMLTSTKSKAKPTMASASSGWDLEGSAAAATLSRASSPELLREQDWIWKKNGMSDDREEVHSKNDEEKDGILESGLENLCHEDGSEHLRSSACREGDGAVSAESVQSQTQKNRLDELDDGKKRRTEWTWTPSEQCLPRRGRSSVCRVRPESISKEG
jgi:hypothetical protein